MATLPVCKAHNAIIAFEEHGVAMCHKCVADLRYLLDDQPDPQTQDRLHTLFHFVVVVGCPQCEERVRG